MYNTPTHRVLHIDTENLVFWHLAIQIAEHFIWGPALCTQPRVVLLRNTHTHTHEDQSWTWIYDPQQENLFILLGITETPLPACISQSRPMTDWVDLWSQVWYSTHFSDLQSDNLRSTKPKSTPNPMASMTSFGCKFIQLQLKDTHPRREHCLCWVRCSWTHNTVWPNANMTTLLTDAFGRLPDIFHAAVEVVQEHQSIWAQQGILTAHVPRPLLCEVKLWSLSKPWLFWAS